jgi:hypothetical protein
MKEISGPLAVSIFSKQKQNKRRGKRKRRKG